MTAQRITELLKATIMPAVRQLVAQEREAERTRLMSAFGSLLNLHRNETVIRSDLELFTPAEREWMDACIEDIKRLARTQR